MDALPKVSRPPASAAALNTPLPYTGLWGTAAYVTRSRRGTRRLPAMALGSILILALGGGLAVATDTVSINGSGKGITVEVQKTTITTQNNHGSRKIAITHPRTTSKRDYVATNEPSRDNRPNQGNTPSDRPLAPSAIDPKRSSLSPELETAFVKDFQGVLRPKNHLACYANEENCLEQQVAPAASNESTATSIPTMSSQFWSAQLFQSVTTQLSLPPLQTSPSTGNILINEDTYAFLESPVQDLELRVLDVPVRIRAEPLQIIWDWGDGTVTKTTDPGAPWPSGQVKHRYTAPGDYVISGQVSWKVRYTYPGGTGVLPNPLTTTSVSHPLRAYYLIPYRSL